MAHQESEDQTESSPVKSRDLVAELFAQILTTENGSITSPETLNSAQQETWHTLVESLRASTVQTIDSQLLELLCSWLLSETRQSPQSRIGRWEILAPIGKGGMGEVYRCFQITPFFREGAVKILPMGQKHPDENIQQFQWEVQALAHLDHPNIVPIYDAGTAEDGTPFYVMPYLNGRSILAYCDKAGLPVNARLNLFRQLCRGVAYAHRKALVHQDLKPSNVMVIEEDGEPRVKIIDFGIATSLSSLAPWELEEQARRPSRGTPSYAPPAQWRNIRDTRHDIYAAGTILFELTSGLTPKQRHTPEFPLDATTDSKPLLSSFPMNYIPSKESAAHRATTPKKLARFLLGDIDRIICHTALPLEAGGYATIKECEEDISRLLEKRPISRGPRGFFYIIQAFFRRHQQASMVCFAILLLLGFLGFGWLHTEKRRKQSVTDFHQAKNQTAATQHQLENLVFLIEELLSGAHPETLGAYPQLPNMLEQAATSLDATPPPPILEAGIRIKLGRAFHGLGRYERALAQFTSAHQLRKTLLGPADPSTLAAAFDKALALLGLGETKKARVWLEGCRQQAQKLPRNHPIRLRLDLAMVDTLQTLGQYTPAKTLAESALAVLADTPTHQAPYPSLQAHATFKHAVAVLPLGDYQNAETAFREVVDWRSNNLGIKHPDTLEAAYRLGETLLYRAKYKEALSVLETTQAMLTGVLGENHLRVRTITTLIAETYRRTHRFEEAEKLLRQVIQGHGQDRNPYGLYTILAKNNLIAVLAAQAKTKEAVTIALENKTAFEIGGWTEHPGYQTILNNTADMMIQSGRPREAIPLLETALEKRLATFGAKHNKTLIVRCTLAEALQQSDELAAALVLFRDIYKVSQSLPGNEVNTALFGAYLGNALTDAGNYDEAEKVLKKSASTMRDRLGRPGQAEVFLKRLETLR
ncbi:serine/threonine-protein kinase [Acanthopleuribacter pedis]|uniref:Serine/threonine protein kinase n=1 Tax=Acanthopleuribacter pedis TaxID=442870 RepID=A0A8J7QCU9_9BACT|nr:serine/threonine-protein kinase [Acanthopleuribacter pedis]MBO1322167.1 serine/threonine protein kinase [Acanthopleuribacter pedis]